MRIWKGTEKEIGIYQGQEMLFIEGKKINLNIILSFANKENINYLYFGAGKVEFTDFKKLQNLPPYIIILIETARPEKIPQELKCTVVYRVETPELRKNTVLKIETKNIISTIHLAQLHTTTPVSLNTETMMYTTDELLYTEEER